MADCGAVRHGVCANILFVQLDSLLQLCQPHFVALCVHIFHFVGVCRPFWSRFIFNYLKWFLIMANFPVFGFLSLSAATTTSTTATAMTSKTAMMNLLWQKRTTHKPIPDENQSKSQSQAISQFDLIKSIEMNWCLQDGTFFCLIWNGWERTLYDSTR